MNELYTPRLASLRRKLKEREGEQGTDKERKALRAEIARLEKTEIDKRLAEIRTKLRASTGKAGYEKRCDKIRAEIARLEALQKQEFDL